MKRLVPLALLTLLTPALYADVPPPEEQIAAAILAAPEGRREGAAVIGWNDDGKPVPLRDVAAAHARTHGVEHTA